MMTGETSGYQKMRAGESYAAPDFALLGMQAAAREKLDVLNATREPALRETMLREQLGQFGQSFLLSPVMWEYGKHIFIGDGVFINFDCVFLDGGDVRIGDGTAVGPRVQFLTAGHPLDASERIRRDPQTGGFLGAVSVNEPITIGRDCWIGAGAIILGGVSIGDGTTIGAGSVVTHDIPAGVLAAGNPCRVVRKASRRVEGASAA